MDYIKQFIEHYPSLENIVPDIKSAFDILAGSFSKGRKLLIAGNGGSAADAEHITGELMKSFLKKRKLPDSFIADIGKVDSEIAQYLVSFLQPGLPVIPLSSHTSLNTACINDINGNIIFAQQVYGYGKEGDVLLGISTSGNSKSVLYAAAVAKAKKIKVIALTGNNGGKLKNFADVLINVPEIETWKIQELHLPIYHLLCMMLEDCFFNE